MKFVLPGILFVFSLSMMALWLAERSYAFLLKCCGGFFLIAVAMVMQTAGYPTNAGLNVVLNGTCFIIGIQLLCMGILQRAGYYWSITLCAFITVVIIGLDAYYYYIDQNLLARIYIINFSMAGFCLFAVFTMRKQYYGSLADKLLLLILLLIGLHFLPRVWLTTASLGKQMLLTELYQTSFWNWLIFSSAVLGTVLCFVIFIGFGSDVLKRFGKLHYKDQLTGLLSRKGLQALYNKPERSKQVATKSILICDLDQFYLINRAYGHQAGDVALVQFANMVAGLASSGDLSVRIGANCFVLIKENTSLNEAHEIAEFLRQKMEQTNFADFGMEQVMTCTILVIKQPLHEDIGDVLNKAENAMKRVKQGRRNRVVVMGDNELNY